MDNKVDGMHLGIGQNMGISRKFCKFVLAVFILPLLFSCGGEEQGTNEFRKSIASPPPFGDTRLFSGPRNDYSILKTSTGYLVVDALGKQEPAVITVETWLQFSDFIVNLKVAEKGETIEPRDLNKLIELYIAFFNRVPDADGLSYWIDQLKAGMSFDAISENFYRAAILFTKETGYSSTMSNAEFVRIIYKNVLGRTGVTAPPEVDVQYWANELDSGQSSKGRLIGTMLYAAHTFEGDATWGWVPQLLNNKIEVARYFSIQHGLNYLTPSESVTNGMAIASAVSTTDVLTAKSLIGVKEVNFNLQGAYKGRFVDAPVAGLSYQTSVRRGVTDAQGYFRYDSPGEIVSFSIGEFSIGQAQATEQVHVFDLQTNQEERLAGRNVRVAQLLQSLDDNQGKSDVIRIPQSAASQFKADFSLEFSGSQSTYEVSLQKILTSVDSTSKLVSKELARAKAEAYVSTLMAKCPLSHPTSPDSIGQDYRIVTGNLTCLDIARINYYEMRVRPLLENEINASLDKINLVSQTWNSDTAQALIDKNAVIGMLQVIDTVVEATEPSNQANSVNQTVSLGKIFISSAQAITNLLINFDSTDGDVVKEADLARKQLELSSKVLDTIGSAASCSSFFRGQRDSDATACIKAVSDSILLAEKGYTSAGFRLNIAVDQAALKAKLRLIADEFLLANASIKFVGQVEIGGDKLKRAGFGVASAIAKVARDAITLVYTGRGQTVPRTGWMSVSLGMIDHVAIPVANIGKSCWGTSKLDPVAYTKCISTGTQELIKVSLNGAVSLIGSVEAVRVAGTMNEAIVAQAVLEEILWAGTANVDKVFAKYSLPVGATPFNLVAAIGEKKRGMNGLASYADVFSLIWAATWKGQNSFSVPDTIHLVNIYMNMIERESSPDFDTSSIVYASEALNDGSVNLRVTAMPNRKDFRNGKLVCTSDGAVNYSSQDPWHGEVSDMTSHLINFKYSSAGAKVVTCSLFTASRLFVGSRAYSISSLKKLATVLIPSKRADLWADGDVALSRTQRTPSWVGTFIDTLQDGKALELDILKSPREISVYVSRDPNGPTLERIPSGTLTIIIGTGSCTAELKPALVRNGRMNTAIAVATCTTMQPVYASNALQLKVSYYGDAWHAPSTWSGIADVRASGDQAMGITDILKQGDGSYLIRGSAYIVSPPLSARLSGPIKIVETICWNGDANARRTFDTVMLNNSFEIRWVPLTPLTSFPIKSFFDLQYAGQNNQNYYEGPSRAGGTACNWPIL